MIAQSKRLRDMVTTVRAPGINYVDVNSRPIRPVEPARLKLRERDTLSPSKLGAKCGELLRTAFDCLQSAGALAMTLRNVAEVNYAADDVETLDLIRQVCRDASADVSQAVYRLPSTAGQLPVVAANGACVNFT